MEQAGLPKEEVHMLQKMRERMGREEGFTLVELLVVMLILGLLAAIAIPSFFNQRDKARDSDAKADARTAQTAIETYATDHDGAYNGPPAPDGAALNQIESTIPVAGTTVVASTPTTYTVRTTSETDTTFDITRTAGGQTDSDCSDHGEGGCPSDGKWAGDGT